MKSYKVIDDAVSHVTIHGLRNIHRVPSVPLKVLFTLMWLTSFAFCLYAVIVVCQAYSTYGKQTTIKIVNELSEFPTIQICNLNPFDQSSARDHTDQMAEKFRSQWNNLTNQTYEYVTLLRKYIQNQLLLENLKTPDDLYDFGFYLNGMLLGCRFRGQNCSPDNFILIYNSYYGRCYRFNQGKWANGSDARPIQSAQAGWYNGLQLELYAGDVELQEKFTVTRGFRISVLNKSYLYQNAQDKGVDIPTGQATSIGVRRTIRNHIGPPYGDCLENDISKVDWSRNEVLSFMKYYFVDGNYFYSGIRFENDTGIWNWNWTITYSQSVCVKMCLQMYIYKECNCYDLSLPKSRSIYDSIVSSGCDSDVDIECVLDRKESFYSGDEIRECYSMCPIECQEVQYDMTLSQAAFPSKWYRDQLVEDYFSSYQNNTDTLKDSIARVNIYYDHLYHTLIDESPAMTFDGFLSVLGGYISLFLGASFLFVIEAIAFIFNMITVKTNTIKSSH